VASEGTLPVDRPAGAPAAYERITGSARFTLDPRAPANARITDLELAPRTPAGLVAVTANFELLVPAGGCRAPCTVLLEAANRGRRTALGLFNRAPMRYRPRSTADLGDGFLQRQGLVLAWVGWQFDAPRRPGALVLEAPVLHGPGGETLTGLARSDWVVDSPVDRLALGHRGHRPYPPVPASERHRLTRRAGRLAAREPIPRPRWRFVQGEEGEGLAAIALEGGFEPGFIYELVYEARDPVLAGAGLAVLRDFASFLRNAQDSPVPAERILGMGYSQSGRLLRHLLYEGFSRDEAGRTAFDGLFIAVAGAGRGSFNHRFAQPSRDGHAYSAFFYPTDLFPFSTRRQCDPRTGRCAGLGAGRQGERPRIMQVNTGYEYWGRAAALIHTGAAGDEDVAPAAGERLYHIAGAQHFSAATHRPARLPSGLAWYPRNPIDLRGNLRALLAAMVAWVRAGEAPPPSRLPRLADGTLVPLGGYEFPRIAGFPPPRAAHQAHRLDFGPRWREGLVTRQPPRVGAPFPLRVPAVDRYGNERGGIRNPELAVPLGTYTPWQRRDNGWPRDFLGSFVPLQRSPEAVRPDARPRLEAQYAGREAYARQLDAALAANVEQGFLLPADAARRRRLLLAWWDRLQAPAP